MLQFFYDDSYPNVNLKQSVTVVITKRLEVTEIFVPLTFTICFTGKSGIYTVVSFWFSRKKKCIVVGLLLGLLKVEFLINLA